MTTDLLSTDAETSAPATPAATDAAPETEAAAPAASPDSSAETKGDEAPPEDGGSLLGDDLTSATPDDGEEKGDDAAAEDAPADDFELEVPKDAHFAPDAVEKVKALAKEHGLSKEAAQALLNEYDGALAATAETYQAQVRETFEGFGKEIKADPKWGGANLPATKSYFAQALDKYAPGYRQSLHDSGAMLEPAQYLAWAAVGKAMSEAGGPITSTENPKPEGDYSKSFNKTPAKYGGSLKE